MLSPASYRSVLRQVATSRTRPALISAASSASAAAWAPASAPSTLISRPLPRSFSAPVLLSVPALSATPASRSHFHATPRRLLEDKTREAIDKAVASAPVVLFMKGTPELPQCGFSRALVQILGLQGVDPAKFHAFNVLEDASLRSGIKEYSDWPTIPQLYVGGEFIGGCDIIATMHQNGELAKLLGDKDVLVLADPAESEHPT